MTLRVGIDIGGTFTDLVALDEAGRIHTRKVSSSGSGDRASSVGEALAALLGETGLTAVDVSEVLHGTTVVSNAILEGKGARTGLITTRGFRDVLEIRRLRMPRLYDLRWEKPPPLVERWLRMEVDERVSARGEVIEPLDEGGVEEALDRLRAAGVETLAVCLLHAWADPTHEQRIRDRVRARAPALPVCLSSEVLPEIREYERTSTTVVNAYVQPVVQRYLEGLEETLRTLDVRAPLRVMQSNGGLMTAPAARERPVHIIESGPAAGVVGARVLARRLGLDRVLTLDMGGTTAKTALIEDGEVARAAETQVGGGILVGSRLLTGGGYLVRVPAIDLAEVGAGGGSIVRIDAGGALRVGPESAGAVPGPLCYDLGGHDPTVTDANLVLGYLNPVALAGGEVPLDPERARAGLAEKVAGPLGLNLVDAAYGAHLVAASNMMRGVRAVSSERGRDPREFALVAFGGNGPLFAAGIARALGIRRVVVPPAPGLFSAFGLLCSEVEHHAVRSWRRPLEAADPAELDALWERMERAARAQLAADGFTGAAARIHRSADLCYRGQSFELTVPVAGGATDAGALAALAETFGSEHERTYGHRGGTGEPVEIVSLRVTGRGVADRPRMPERVAYARRDPRAPTPSGSSPGDGARRAWFGPDAGWLDTPVLPSRDALVSPRPGPLLVDEYDATCLVPPGTTASLDGHGNLVLDLEGAAP